MGNPTIMSHPDLLPESTDPAGSTRYYVTIMERSIPWYEDSVTFVNLIRTNSLFVVDKLDSHCSTPKTEIFDGVVLKEKNGKYSWWRRLKQEKKYPTIAYVSTSQE